MCEPRRPGLVGPPGFHTTAREPKRHILGFRPSKTPPKFNEKTPRETQKERNGGGKGKKKSEILGGPAEGGPAEGGPSEGGPAEGGPAEGGPAEGGRRSGGVQTHNHKTTTTTTNTKRQQTQNDNKHKTTTQQHNNTTTTTTTTTTTKIGQNTETLKLAEVSLAKVGQDHDWPKSVKKLAKVGLAKVGLAKVGHDRRSCGCVPCLFRTQCHSPCTSFQNLVDHWFPINTQILT